MNRWAALTVAAALLAASGAARAADAVKIGAIYPLTGAGAEAKLAIETAEDIVNNPHQGLETLPLGAGQGLPALNGAKVDVVFADDLDNPSVAQSQALRLVAQDRVAALIGGGRSPVTLAASAFAERRGIPFLVPAATDPKITGRGFKWVFRTTPLGSDFAKLYVQFLGELKQAGSKADTVALVFANSEAATGASGTVRDALKAAGFNIAAEIGIAADATDLSPQVMQLRDKNPDVAMFFCDAAEAILFAKTMKTLNYKPPVEIGDDAGFSDPTFIAAVGNLEQDVIDRSVWSLGKPNGPTAIFNDLYKAKSGRNLGDADARIVEGFFVLADAINRAGSTDPATIQKALRETDLKPDQLIVGFDGVKFDETGQNALASSYLIQLQGKEYVSVWPAANAAGKLVLPFKGWE